MIEQKSGSHGDQTSPKVITPVASGNLPNTLADSPTNEECAVHFGPVYGRRTGQSMALCDKSLPPAGFSRTMTRSPKMVTCNRCEQEIQDLVNSAVQRGAA